MGLVDSATGKWAKTQPEKCLGQDQDSTRVIEIVLCRLLLQVSKSTGFVSPPRTTSPTVYCRRKCTFSWRQTGTRRHRQRTKVSCVISFAVIFYRLILMSGKRDQSLKCVNIYTIHWNSGGRFSLSFSWRGLSSVQREKSAAEVIRDAKVCFSLKYKSDLMWTSKVL